MLEIIFYFNIIVCKDSKISYLHNHDFNFIVFCELDHSSAERLYDNMVISSITLNTKCPLLYYLRRYIFLFIAMDYSTLKIFFSKMIFQILQLAILLCIHINAYSKKVQTKFILIGIHLQICRLTLCPVK